MMAFNKVKEHSYIVDVLVFFVRSKAFMPYNDPARLTSSPGLQGPSGMLNTLTATSLNGRDTRTSGKEAIFHGESLARDMWGEQYGPWIVLGFSAAFALFLILMVLMGQKPGQSFMLKSVSDILQFVGEGVGFVFCVRIAQRLYRVSRRLKQQLLQREHGEHFPTPHDMALARNEAQLAQRSFLAWSFLALAILSYATGQAIWTSYDVRMNSADVPFPGIYDIGFVMSYPLFLIGTLLLTRRNKATVGRTRLVLDALAVIGAALSLSWFFLLGPSISGLAQAPSFGAAFLSIYFPTGDLFLVAVGAFLMFSPLSNRAQQPVFLRLCLGLFFLAITDSLLSFYSLSNNFNTGTLQDVLWPLSMMLVGLAAIEYPRCVAHQQEQEARTGNTSSLSTTSRSSQISLTLQTITPFILALLTCATLLAVVAPRGGTVLIQADVVALALVIIVVIRQALTLMENNRLTMQMRGELVISRRELQVTRREADEATRTAQEKRILEEGVTALREIHARVSRGDFTARASTVPGPLLPIAISLNLMLDRLSSMSQRGAKYDQLVQESRMLQVAVERLGQGLPAWAPNQPAPQSRTELRPVFLGLVHLQRFQEGQWRRLTGTIESMGNLVRRLRDALAEIRHSSLFEGQNQANFERMILERALREVELLDQQQKTLYSQSTQLYHDARTSNTPAPSHNHAHHLPPTQEQRTHQPHKTLSLPVEPAALQFTNGAQQPGQELTSAPDQSVFYKLYQAYYQNGKATEDL
jgi:hypothetical protein